MYQVQISNRAAKALEKLPDGLYERIREAIQDLAENPRPTGCKKLKGRLGYRIRVGDYRIVYEIEDDKLLVLIIDIGHRREIYR
ncbi:type II toxin-antitoxin system RelE family toxin [Spirosoma validum]|uniref:Type II toxin-antitoxin system RelE/ParE family toxin n=1 Tax=Spirosoma validum TaxID=2771355 RepID=A0A927GBH7_9BACT|nr:type II toxin-antitoxin system RelE/ParE family toxin [Spirosoma validum]MBD2751495.1 type II toxin-antitoxin system RelE/ParE family toxin [Spirosoma validum]